MSDVALILLGAAFGGLVNLGAQLTIRRIERRRRRRLACRILHGELAEFADGRINAEEDIETAYLHAAWREHRGPLIDSPPKDWVLLNEAVMRLVYPNHFPPTKPDSAPLPGPVERAFSVLERHGGFPSPLKSDGS